MRLLAMWLALVAPLQAAEWRLIERDSFLRFSGESQGERFEGMFHRFEADIRFDPESPDRAQFAVGIDLTSADTQNEERDEVLRGPDFFAIEEFPQARFVAEDVRVLGNGRFAAYGTLALRGVERPITLEFRWDRGDPATLEGRATLQRLAYGIGTGDWADTELIADEVIVETRLALRRAD